MQPTKIKFKTLSTALLLTMTAATLSGCGIPERLSAIGKPPVMDSIRNPYAQPGYVPVTMPMPTQVVEETQPNSLWEKGRQTFFKDQRAHRVGDILTVLIDIKDQADLKNKTERTRDGDETMGLPNMFGLETLPKKVLPKAYDPSSLMSMNSASTSTGDGKITREEDISLKLAVTVTQVLPNGNFVIHGTQEMRVNYELRQLSLDGIVRPEDILSNNSISYDKIAEARISYGGRGEMSDIQVPRYGQQFYDAVSPF